MLEVSTCPAVVDGEVVDGEVVDPSSDVVGTAISPSELHAARTLGPSTAKATVRLPNFDMNRTVDAVQFSHVSDATDNLLRVDVAPQGLPTGDAFTETNVVGSRVWP